MKKIIILIATFLPIFAHAENMCVKNGSVMVVLDPQINGTALASNATDKTWSVQFPYGIISGIGGCASINCRSSAIGCLPSSQNITPYQEGNYCFCKMLHPIESVFVWAGMDSGNGAPSCKSNCAAGCAKYAAQSVIFRVGMFGNVIE